MNRPKLMGVVNVTPDSFSDGGEFLDPARAVEHARKLVADGADIVDIGGESTRPGAEPVGAPRELLRVIPVIEGLAGIEAQISIDTAKATVAEPAIDAGATIVNDVTALGDIEMAPLCAKRGVGLILMHMQGTPRNMQADPRYDDVVDEVRAFLEARIAVAVDAGVAEERIWIDPGIGFGKTVEHNLELLRRLDELTVLGRPIVIGASRKQFLGELTGRGKRERLHATIAANVLAFAAGAQVFRVHDVAEHRDALRVAQAVRDGRLGAADDEPLEGLAQPAESGRWRGLSRRGA